MYVPFARGLLAVVLSMSPVLLGQGPAQSMLATDRYLFVLHGGVLRQFDVHTLQLLNVQVLEPRGAGKDPVAAIEVVQEPSEMVIEETVVEGVTEEVAVAPVVRSAIDLQQHSAAALVWLASHQDDDGKWDCDQFMKHDRTGEPCDGPGNAVHDVGVTGLALLAMLGSGSTMRHGPYKDHLRRGVDWLRAQQQENGLIGLNASHDFIYDHAIASFALCEAAGLSKSKLLRPVAQKAINYLESHRNPYSVWRYQPRDNDNDTSVTTWAVCAVTSANRFGLEVNPTTLQVAAIWYDQVSSPDGRAGYTRVGERSSRKPGDHAKRFPVRDSETLTAAAAAARLLLGQTPADKPVLKAAGDVLAKHAPGWKRGTIDAVYWYFGAMAAHQLGGRTWRAWSAALPDLAAHQCTEGNAAGSWDTVGVWDEDGGRVFVTALYAMALQIGARERKLVR